MDGLRASSCPLLQRGSIAWKVAALAARPSSPNSNFIVGTQSPKSRPREEATNPSKVPVTGSETAPDPTAGAPQARVCPDPVQVDVSLTPPAAGAPVDAAADSVAAAAVVAAYENVSQVHIN
jgi:hypothetical protein